MEQRKIEVCSSCGRVLTNQESRDRHMGPKCSSKARKRAIDVRNHENFDLPWNPRTMDVVCRRTDGESEDGGHFQLLEFNVPWMHVYHSPSGMEWGYSGSGPADFALNILAMFLPGRDVHLERSDTWVSAEAMAFHQTIKSVIVATIPREGSTIPGTRIQAAIEGCRGEPMLRSLLDGMRSGEVRANTEPKDFALTASSST